MEIEQMEMDEIETNNKLEEPIYKKKNSKKNKKNSLSSKLVIGILLSITFIAFLALNLFSSNYKISIEKNDKNEINYLMQIIMMDANLDIN